jgi:hypothetical protein
MHDYLTVELCAQPISVGSMVGTIYLAVLEIKP